MWIQREWTATHPARRCLVCGFVVAGGAAGFAVHETVGAKADIKHRLAETTEFFALATAFWLLALCAHDLAAAGSGTHRLNLARHGSPQEMTLVIGSCPGNQVVHNVPFAWRAL